jgi:hypothetical protein
MMANQAVLPIHNVLIRAVDQDEFGLSRNPDRQGLKGPPNKEKGRNFKSSFEEYGHLHELGLNKIVLK